MATDADAIKALKDLVEAVTELVRALGVGPFVGLVVFAVASLIGYQIYRDFMIDKRANAIAEEKEKEIVRLAAVNRELRTELMRLKGIPDKVLTTDDDDSRETRKKGGSK